jgi:hypothetical protein
VVPDSTLALVSTAAYQGRSSGREASVSISLGTTRLHVHAPVSAHIPGESGMQCHQSLAAFSVVKDLVSEYNVVWLGTPVQPLLGLAAQ